jgi:uncharacterized protein
MLCQLTVLKYYKKKLILFINMDSYIDKLSKILEENNVCRSHGIDHAIKVMDNARTAILSELTLILPFEYKSILLAGLLHDADDNKFFPNNKNYENVRKILEDEESKIVSLVIKMIDLVSSSKNGDSIPDYAKKETWLLIPRYADRLEAIGLVGIERCYQYAKTTNNPLYISSTPRPKSEEEIWTIANIERYKLYNGKSLSMIDHYYDKLLRCTFFPIKNYFFDKETKERRKILIDFILYFSNKEEFTDDDVLDFIKNHCNSK